MDLIYVLIKLLLILLLGRVTLATIHWAAHNVAPVSPLSEAVAVAVAVAVDEVTKAD